MPSSNRALSLALFSTLLSSSDAFSVQPSKNLRTSVDLNLAKTNGEFSRRDALISTFGVASVLSNSNIAWAGGSPPTKEDLQRIKVGYEGLTYLLANFEQETTICRENGGECKRDADPVRRYMGLRSTTDPLFQIEKVFAKVKNMDLDPDQLEAFFEATEDWNTAMNMSNSMAFISQFGEYNPGGGKDEVLKYLEEAKIQVVRAQKSLKTIMECLEIS
mmetsp:Transcript_10878/g.15343  ORF Transcript_10878/g.15343 Transcript_10878/m.15343 type:complete len:218 (+) Transcript_10878:101-754(+)